MTQSALRGRGPGPWLVALAGIVISLFAATTAWSQPMQPEVEGGVDARTEGSMALGLGGAKIGEDWFLRLSVAFNLTVPDVTLARQGTLFDEDQTHPLRFLFFAPFNLRIKDNAPRQDQTLRSEDWDEPAEYLRLLRVIEYGTPYDGIYFRAGELTNVRIGHRTIVDNYINTLDVDNFQWGLHANLNTIYGGSELLLDNLAEPELIGTRLYVRPWEFIDPEAYATRLAFGLSLFGDARAPAVLRTDPDGRYVLDNNNDFISEQDRSTGILGFDVELALVREERVSVTPYTDVNVHLGRGAGWHIGSFYGFQPSDQIVLDFRTEYRMLGKNYLPTYFGPLYEIERFAYRTLENAPVALPKLQWLRSGQEDEFRHGYLLEGGLNIGGKFLLSALWEDYQGRNNSTAWIRLQLPQVWKIRLGAYYANTRFQGVSGLFDLDNALAIAELRFMLTSWLYIQAQGNRRWQLNQDGEYQPVDDWSVMAGASFGF